MKHLLLTTIAAVVLVACGESQQSAPAPETPPVEPVVEAAQPEPTKTKAPPSWIKIHTAAQMGQIEAVKQHLAGGADVNAKDKYGGTPLHLSATFGHKEIVELLITKGADVNAKGGESMMTPLLGAVAGGHNEIIELLIARDADVNAKSSFGMTPLDVAISLLQTKTADLLRKHGGKHSTINTAATAGDAEAVKEFLATGTEVNAKDEDSWTPLHYAAGGGQKEIAELLIAEGANTNVKDKLGDTPLQVAAYQGHKEIAELFIDNGADVNAKADNGKTPLDWADGETADLLRKHGGKTGAELKAAGK